MLIGFSNFIRVSFWFDSTISLHSFFADSSYRLFISVNSSLAKINVSPVTHFPAPNGPGIAATPPFASGNKESKILCPVIKGESGISFFRIGLLILTGQFCLSLNSNPLSSFPITSFTVNFPDFSSVIFPFWLGGTIILCISPGLSSTSPIIAPPLTSAPAFKIALKSHFFWGSKPGASTPRLIKSPICLIKTGSGL